MILDVDLMILVGDLSVLNTETLSCYQSQITNSHCPHDHMIRLNLL